jgi:hypothetical protein
MAESVGELAAKRAGEPEFLMGGQAAPAKRAGKRAKVEAVEDLQPLPARIYTNITLFEHHREALERYAWDRKRKRITRKIDMGAVVRDVLDYWLDHEKEVADWIKRKHTAQGQR